jgi:hypothetical protein
MISDIWRNNQRLTIKTITILLVFILTWSNTATFANEAGKKRGEGTPMPEKGIEQVLKEHTVDLMSLSGVIGTGQGLLRGKACIKVFVDRKTPRLEQKIPKNLGGYPVVIQETGTFKSIRDIPQ